MHRSGYYNPQITSSEVTVNYYYLIAASKLLCKYVSCCIIITNIKKLYVFCDIIYFMKHVQ